MDWQLRFDDNGLRLELLKNSQAAFLRSGLYKLSLRRYIQRVDSDIVFFRKDLSYIDYERIIALCRRGVERFSCGLTVANELLQYIDARQMYIEERSRLGIELKRHDVKFQDRFEIYRDTVNSIMIRHLRDQQMWDSFFMCAMQKSANFSVPGSGKTASALGMYAYLYSKKVIKRILVICPKNAFGSWIDEYNACFGSKLPLRVLNVHDKKYSFVGARKNALLYESGNCNLILINYESVGSIEYELRQVLNSSTMLVFDEVHKVKRIGGEHAGHTLALARHASYVIAMTGTPIPNTYLDVYNMLHILFPDEYNVFFDFSIQTLGNPTQHDIDKINDKLQPFFCRTTKQQLGVPEANEDITISVSANEIENRLLHIMRMRYRRNKLTLLLRVLQLESDPRMLLRNLNLNEFRYLLDDTAEIDQIDFADYSDEVMKLINSADSATKMDICIKLVRQLVTDGKTVVIWCIFVDSIKRISQSLENIGISTKCVWGEVPLEERQMILSSFRSKEFNVLITNPHTLAESVSLHDVCHDAVYFEYSYNLVHLLQSKDRIHRLGLPQNQYTQYYYLQTEYLLEDGSTWSLDSNIYERLSEKEQTMLDAIDNHVLETMPTSEEDLNLIFSKLF